LKTKPKNITVLKETDSTNNYANRHLLSKAAEEGAAVLAHFQKKGRGQSGNSWESEPGMNILASVLLYPTFIVAHQQFYLSKITSLAILDFLSEKTTKVSIKWPNDIYVGNKKIGGILIENSVQGNALHSSILGMGININQQKFPETIPNPISLKQITGTTYKTKELLEAILHHINRWYELLKQGYTEKIDRDYLHNLFRFNEWHKFRGKDKIFMARIIGIGEIGQLLLEHKNGKTDAFLFKEVEYVL
jgi:BirA family biotin operon repressor/biotin-[acetyl-CoA-carboxylase] ligase